LQNFNYLHWTGNAISAKERTLAKDRTYPVPGMAVGEQEVKTLVCFVPRWRALLSTEYHFQLVQLNNIARLCQQFRLKCDMSEANSPLLTVEFSSLRGHRMDGIDKVGRSVLAVFPSC